MHPAFSVIFFTTASGAGYGLLAWLGIVGSFDLLPAERYFGLASFAIAFAAVIGGLSASTFHLGRPERAWRAFSQWRSSWLSREGLVSVVTFLPAGIFALGWIGFANHDGAWGASALLASAACMATVYCTAMIYAALKTVQRWHNRWVVPNYLILSLASGVVLLQALAIGFGLGREWIGIAALACLILAMVAKLGYWRFIDRSASRSDSGSATGLGSFGRVALLDAPHTEENYLMREMGFRIARKHAQKLRRIALLLAFALPMLLTLLIWFVGGAAALALAIVAAICHLLGLLIERWLFFAEAKHVVTLYYGATRA
jgi:sulfite dehydrogenase (quinone) subunit SoeC